MVDKINKIEMERQNDVEKIKKCEGQLSVLEEGYADLSKKQQAIKKEQVCAFVDSNIKDMGSLEGLKKLRNQYEEPLKMFLMKIHEAMKKN